ncbi:Peroxidase 16 [Triticum urartu]|uniref:Plant heme peroxidase family profile domain-containing protein n=2 Tax=Triticum TaxID=4564 RepID=A0A9R0ZLV1_TRITD|nr:Peroxidase 16 [Triticum urartu]VAI79236.1 unnamed protein product [Triticum turgidum subsp. durum]
MRTRQGTHGGGRVHAMESAAETTDVVVDMGAKTTRRNYYAKTCPNVEALVRGAVTQKLQETFNAAPGTLRLFFHDCFVRAGGPSYPVELGRLDGKVGTRAVVKHSLPGAGFSLDQLNKLFAANGLTQTDMIALSGGHTIGVTHCDKFVRRLYTFKGARPQYSPPMNLAFLRQMRGTCPLNYSPATVAMLDAVTPNRFDNGYYQTLQQQKGLLSSDQVLFADRRSRATVNHFASNQTAFFDAFVAAMAKLGRIGVKTAGSDAEIRRVCTKVN